MRTSGWLIAACLLLEILSRGSAAAAAELADSAWRVTEIGGTTVPAKPAIILRFKGEDRVEGHGGCNGFFGAYEINGDKVEIGPLGATQMACDEAVMKRELQFLDALTGALAYRKDGNKLYFRNESDATAAVLIRTDGG